MALVKEERGGVRELEFAPHRGAHARDPIGGWFAVFEPPGSGRSDPIGGYDGRPVDGTEAGRE